MLNQPRYIIRAFEELKNPDIAFPVRGTTGFMGKIQSTKTHGEVDILDLVVYFLVCSVSRCFQGKESNDEELEENGEGGHLHSLFSLQRADGREGKGTMRDQNILLLKKSYNEFLSFER
jgi:hypothetical protein